MALIHDAPPAARPLRVVSYNVRYFGHALRGLASTHACQRRIAEALVSLDPVPDLVCLQEVETISLRSTVAHPKRREGETQLESFMAELERAHAARAGGEFPFEAFYFRAHAYRLGATPLYTTGLAILANLRTVRVHAHNAASPHAITHHHVERWKDRKQSRICAHMRVECDGARPLLVFNTHLSLPTPFARAFWAAKDKMGHGVNQVAEARSLAAFVSHHAAGEPFIVCGDFNSPPGSPVFRYLTDDAGFSSAQLALGLIDPTRPRGFPTAGFMALRMHLDHVFYGGPIRCMDMEGTAPFGANAGGFQGLSDHVPLVGRMLLDTGI